MNIRIASIIAWHDLKYELRRPTNLGAVFLFGFSSLIVLRLALVGGAKASEEVLAGSLWILLIFACILGTSRTWFSEDGDNSYLALLICPAHRTTLYLGKLFANFVTTFLLNNVLLVLYLGLFGGPSLSKLWMLLLAVFLSSAGFTSVGVLVSSLSLRAQSKDLLAPLIFLPLAIPLLLAAVTLSLISFNVGSGSLFELITFLCGYNLLFIILGIAIFPEIAVE